jgi:hypothetical protein
MTRILDIISVYLVFTSLIAFAGNIDDSVATNQGLEDRKIAWLNFEYGIHTVDPMSGYGYVRSNGSYGKIMLEIPVGSRIGMAAFADIWSLGHYTHKGIGIGVNFIAVRSGNIDMLITPCIFGGEGLGIIVPVTIGYRILNDKIRLQASSSFRGDSEFSPGGGNSYTFFTFSAGIGLNLSDIFSKK